MSAWLRQPLSFGMWLATCLIIGVLFAAFTVLWTHTAIRAQQAKDVATRQIEGRRVAIDVLCGGLSGVEDAGKQALNGTLEGLHGRGVPDSAIRDYVSTISTAVILQAGVDARKVLKPDGQIDCDKLREAARAAKP